MNSVSRRVFVQGTMGAVLTLPSMARAAADWPTKPINLVIPFPAGNTADLVARLLSEPLQRALGQPIVVENKPGAGGNVAMQAVARSEKDGHTLLLTTASPVVINPAVYKKPGFDVDHDFAPVAALGTVPMVLIANREFAPNTMAEFVDYARKNQAKLNFASVGAGSFSHLGMEMLARALKVELTHIPYKGAASAHSDLIGGRVPFMLDSLGSSNGQLKAGRFKALGVTSRVRSPYIQDIPTLAESGEPALRQFDISVWVGLFAPAGTPLGVIERLNFEIAALLRKPEFRALLSTQYIRASDPMSVQQFSTLVKADSARWSDVAKAINLEIN